MLQFNYTERPGISLVLCLLLFAGLLGGAAAQDTRQLVRERSGDEFPRTALVIGNSGYRLSPLQTPANDAEDVATALREAGFQVTLLKDAGTADMKRAIDEFGRTLRDKGGAGLFYFSGHGIQARNKNYLVPVGALVEGEEDIQFEAVEIGRVLDRMGSAGNPVNIVIVDASRNSPVAGNFRSGVNGLTAIEAPSGAMVAYSAAPGTVSAESAGRNSVFASELIKQIGRAGVQVEEALKDIWLGVREATEEAQSPWSVSSLNYGFSFDPSVKPSPLAETASAEAAEAEPEPAISPLEQAAWDLVKDSTDPGALAVFLREFPNGVYAPVARIKVTRVENDEWESAKRDGSPSALRRFLGKYPDGVNAPTARIMLTKMDRDAWASVDTANQKDVEAYLADFPDGESAAAANLTLRRIEKDSWDSVKDSDKPAGPREYLSRYPAGEYAAEAKLKLVELETADWNRVKDSREIPDLEGFLARYPEGPYAANARQLIEDIRIENTPPPKESRWGKFLQGILNVSTMCQPNADQVAVYFDADYKGQCVVRDVGRYSSANAIGLPDNSMSSVIVGKSVRVRLCRERNFQGGCEEINGNDSNLTNNRIGNDQVSSMIVESRAGGSRPLSGAEPRGPDGYKYCAAENQRCAFSGTRTVAYGINGRFVYKRGVRNGVDCTNRTFGDPAPGTPKACFIQ